MLLWPHRAGVCVPAGRKSYSPLSGNASCGRAIGREITKAGERVRVYFAPSDILMPASCGDYWPLYCCITSSGKNIGSEQLRRKGLRRILCPSPSTLSARVRFFVHRVRERLRASMSRTALLQQQASVVILHCANACLRARCLAFAPADCSDYPPLRRCSALLQW